jgi:hypothetical protein
MICLRDVFKCALLYWRQECSIQDAFARSWTCTCIPFFFSHNLMNSFFNPRPFFFERFAAGSFIAEIYWIGQFMKCSWCWYALQVYVTEVIIIEASQCLPIILSFFRSLYFGANWRTRRRDYGTSPYVHQDFQRWHDEQFSQAASCPGDDSARRTHDWIFGKHISLQDFFSSIASL